MKFKLYFLKMKLLQCILNIISAGATNKNMGLYCNTSNVEDIKFMVKYSENVTECRRIQLLSHFGEDSAPKCSASCCDNYLAQVIYNW